MSNFDLSSIPELVNNALFGGANIIAAQVVCAAVVIMVITMPMMMAHAKFEVFVIIAAMMVLLCTAIGWLETPVMVGMLFIIGAVGAGKIAKRFG